MDKQQQQVTQRVTLQLVYQQGCLGHGVRLVQVWWRMCLATNCVASQIKKLKSDSPITMYRSERDGFIRSSLLDTFHLDFYQPFITFSCPEPPLLQIQKDPELVQSQCKNIHCVAGLQLRLLLERWNGRRGSDSQSGLQQPGGGVLAARHYRSRVLTCAGLLPYAKHARQR